MYRINEFLNSLEHYELVCKTGKNATKKLIIFQTEKQKVVVKCE